MHSLILLVKMHGYESNKYNINSLFCSYVYVSSPSAFSSFRLVTVGVYRDARFVPFLCVPATPYHTVPLARLHYKEGREKWRCLWKKQSLIQSWIVEKIFYHKRVNRMKKTL